MNPGDSSETPRDQPDLSQAIQQPRMPQPALSADDLTTLNEEIAGMARAGLPLDQGLAALASELGRGRLQAVTTELASDLRAGFTLPQALERRGTQVPPFYGALVAAGIRTGRIGEVLSTLTMYARSLAEVRATIISAIFYPLVVIFLGLGLFYVGCTFILPQFDKVFKDFGLRLPTLTLVVLAIGGNIFRMVILPLLVVMGGCTLVRLVLRQSPAGRAALAQFIYALPIVGTLVRSARLAAFTDLLGILVDHGVPLPEAFRLAGEASSDPVTANNARFVEDDLRQGVPLGEVIRKRRFARELIIWMIGLGERRGTLGPTLHQVAEVYRRQVEMRAAILRSVLPPFLVIITAGVLVTFFALATIFPLLALIEGLSGGPR